MALGKHTKRREKWREKFPAFGVRLFGLCSVKLIPFETKLTLSDGSGSYVVLFCRQTESTSDAFLSLHCTPCCCCRLSDSIIFTFSLSDLFTNPEKERQLDDVLQITDVKLVTSINLNI